MVMEGDGWGGVVRGSGQQAAGLQAGLISTETAFQAQVIISYFHLFVFFFFLMLTLLNRSLADLLSERV